MFKKTQRLSRTEFSEFFKVGKKQNFPHFTIVTRPHFQPKVSVVVGKKVAKSAVRRNTLKRRVYAVVRNFYNEQNFNQVLIVIIKPRFNTLPRKTAELELKKAIAQVIKNP